MEGVNWIDVAVGKRAVVLEWRRSGGNSVQKVKGVELRMSEPASDVKTGP